jgi:serine/threonine protein kinase
LLRLRTLPIPEEVVAFICKEMLSAVVYMHVEKQAVLGNIVPKTILISDSAQIRFSDFTHSYASSNIAVRCNQTVISPLGLFFQFFAMSLTTNEYYSHSHAPTTIKVYCSPHRSTTSALDSWPHKWCCANTDYGMFRPRSCTRSAQR